MVSSEWFDIFIAVFSIECFMEALKVMGQKSGLYILNPA